MQGQGKAAFSCQKEVKGSEMLHRGTEKPRLATSCPRMGPATRRHSSLLVKSMPSTCWSSILRRGALLNEMIGWRVKVARFARAGSES